MILPRAIEKVAKWATPEASRYALGGVRIGRRAGACFAEATDGRRLALLEWKDKGEDLDTIVEGKALGKACRDVPKHRNVLMGDKPNGFAEVGDTKVPTVEGKWPQSEKLFEESAIGDQSVTVSVERLRELANMVTIKVGTVSVLLNAKFLLDLADTAKAVGADGLRIRAKDAQSQVVFDCKDKNVDLTAIIMPMAAD